MKFWSFGNFIGLFNKLIPITAWLYRSDFDRKILSRIIFITAITPFIGYFRLKYVKSQYKKQIDSDNQVQQEQIKGSIQQIKLTLDYKNFDYLIIVRANLNTNSEGQIFQKQKILFQLNNQIAQKRQQTNQTFFDNMKFAFLGDQKLFQILSTNVKQDQNNFEFFNNKQKALAQKDMIFLLSISDKPNSNQRQQKIIMQFQYGVNLKGLLRQISKHRHKKFVQSMNF